MARSNNDTKLCHDYLRDCLKEIKQQLNQYEMDITAQSQLFTSTSLPLEDIDQCLKKYIHTERNYLSSRNNKQLNEFKYTIHGQQLSDDITSYPLLSEHIVSLHHHCPNDLTFTDFN